MLPHTLAIASDEEPPLHFEFDATTLNDILSDVGFPDFIIPEFLFSLR